MTSPKWMPPYQRVSISDNSPLEVKQKVSTYYLLLSLLFQYHTRIYKDEDHLPISHGGTKVESGAHDRKVAGSNPARAFHFER